MQIFYLPTLSHTRRVPMTSTEHQCSSKQYAICSNPEKQVKCTTIEQTLWRKTHTNTYPHPDINNQTAVFNESEAIRLCTESLNTVTNEACSQIGFNSTSDEIYNCAADLLLTGDENWIKFAIDRSESLCLQTLEKNITLQEQNPEISNIIRNNTCPLSCSERGSCSNGKCMCHEGFASDDCSFDLSKPLEILGPESGDLYDIDDGYSYVVLEGLEFPSDVDIICQFSGHVTLVGEISHTLDVLNVTADLNTLFAIMCELPVIDTPTDRLRIEYNVSVAVDGFGFSDAINFVVIDTACQYHANSSGIITFYIKDGFCLINGTCYPEGSYKEDALCLECKPKEDLYMWSNSTKEDSPPCYQPANVKVKFDLQWNNSLMPHNENEFEVRPFLRFICDFERYENNAYFYVIYFYVDGSYVNFGTELMVYDTAEASVTEDTLMSKFGFKAGITISCTVGARISSNGQTGSLGTSEGFYAGIKLLNQSISIERGQSSTVYFEQTVPFGCTLSSSLAVSTGDCKLKLSIIKTSTEDVCHSNTIQHRGLDAIEIQGLTTATDSDIWTPQSYSFELVSVESMKGIYGLTTLQFLFHIEASSSHHQFWEHVTSDSVQVNVNGGTDDHIWQGKYCYVVCDPHMRSFDGMHYELQYGGSFLLFKHENIPIQVQDEITSCNGNRRTPYCACGVVVAAGRDVFEIYLCNGQRGIRYKSCLDDVLTVVKKSNANYEIYLPTGSVIHVWLRMRYGLIDIHITPTVHEYRERISGLCGNFDGNIANDCVSKGGSLPCQEPLSSRWVYHPNTFTQSYSLNPTDNLLNTDIDTDSLPSYPQSHKTCNNDINGTSQCSSKQYATCSNPEKQVKCTTNKQTLWRKNHTNTYPHPDINNQTAVFNESAAVRLCTEALNTVTNEACSQIGFNSVSDEIYNCAADLLLTGDEHWIKFAIDRSESLCLETLEKNTTLQEENPDISNIIRNNTCPLNCSERGSCSNGKCMCQERFASDDCSFDLSKPLEILGIESGDLYNIDDGYSYVVVEGLEFPSDVDIICQFSCQVTLVGEISHTLDVLNVTADLNTLFAIICELPVIDTPTDRLGIEYSVSVAVDGFGFSEAINFVVIDTACQYHVNSSGVITFYIKDGFCFINGTCYPEGSYKEDALCLECRPREDLYMWSNSTKEDCIVSDTETLDPASDVITIVISAVTGSLFACIFICVLWCIFKKTNMSNQVKRTISVNDSCNNNDKQTTIASQYSNIEESRVQIEPENETKRTNLDSDINLYTPNVEKGYKFWVSNENQPATDTGANNLSIREDGQECDSEQPSNISADEGRRKKKKTKRKRKRRKIEPECSIGDLAIITEEYNDRWEQNKSRRKSKRQKQDISHRLNKTNKADDKCNEYDDVTFAALSNDGTYWNRTTELKTDTDDRRLDILVRPSNKPNQEGRLNKEYSKTSTGITEAEIVKQTSNPSPRMSDSPSTEKGFNDDKCITNPPETTVALTNISRIGRCYIE
ncbi:uncharacterized protein [Argopecten irradians]|uniref:uncharacterized protein isoform X2 n=1 Tax=Argopecten irradians TaxID=31199 RepID=UPI00371C1E6F